VGAFLLDYTIQSVATNEKVASEHANSALDLGCYFLKLQDNFFERLEIVDPFHGIQLQGF